MEWHTCSSSVDKKNPRARSSFFAGRPRSGGANSCIWAWQIAAREPLMTRTNDQGIQNGQDQEKRMGHGEMV